MSFPLVLQATIVLGQQMRDGGQEPRAHYWWSVLWNFLRT